MFQYIHVTINRYVRAELYGGGSLFQYIHVTINQARTFKGYILVNKFQYIHVTINRMILCRFTDIRQSFNTSMLLLINIFPSAFFR